MGSNSEYIIIVSWVGCTDRFAVQLFCDKTELMIRDEVPFRVIEKKKSRTFQSLSRGKKKSVGEGVFCAVNTLFKRQNTLTSSASQKVQSCGMLN